MSREPVGENHCDITIAEHAEILIYAYAEVGLGFRCEDTYKALIELAGMLKRVYGWDEYHDHGLLVEHETAAKQAAFEREFANLNKGVSSHVKN